MFSFYPAEYRLYAQDRSYKHTQNEFLEFLADGGLITLAAWLALIAFAIIISTKVMRSREVPRFNRYLAGRYPSIADGLFQGSPQEVSSWSDALTFQILANRPN